MKSFIAFVAAAALVFVLAACGQPAPAPDPDRDPEPQSIAAIATEAGDFETLLSILPEDLAEALSDDDAGPFTVFAPTDTAFAALIQTVNDLFGLELEGLTDLVAAVGIDYVTDVLKFHVVEDKFLAADVVAEESLDTLLGEPLAVLADDEGVQVGTDVTGIYANVTDTDIEATNGVIHIIDFVLLPYLPEIEEELPTIAEIAIDDGRFETLVAALVAADLADTFADAGEGPFTVFAPTDDAFDALLADLELTKEQLLELENLADILQLHVVAGAVSSSEAIDAVWTRSLGSEVLYFIVDGDDLLVDGNALVSAPDIQASNGVIHVIDAVLLPKGTIVDVVVDFTEADVPEFTTLLAAVLDADDVVADTLGDVESGPLTVFAPTDAAFAALPGGTLESLTEEQLTDILLYHATSGVLLASQVVALVSDGPVDVEMLNDDEVTVSLADGSVFVNDAEVIITDVLTANGVIHVIDAVLLP